MDQLHQVVGFVEAFCEQHGVAPGDVLRLTLIVEELFTNTIVHGHGGDNEAPVRVRLTVGTTHLALHFEDSAPPFDPLKHLAEAPPSRDKHVDAREPGGLGLALVAEMSEQFDYAHVDGFNSLYLVLKRD